MRLPSIAALMVAVVVASAAAQSSRDHVEAMRHLRLGQENLRAERWDKAETEFKAAIKLDALIELAHYGLGQSYMGLKRFDEAVLAYKNCRDAFHQLAGTASAGRLRDEQRILEQIQQLEDQKVQLQSKTYTVPAGCRSTPSRESIRSSASCAHAGARTSTAASRRRRPGSRWRWAAPTSAAVPWPTPSGSIWGL